MKDVYYDGSLKDDIELINDNDKLYYKISLRDKLHLFFLVACIGIYIAIYSITKKTFPWLTLYIVAINLNSSSMRNLEEKKEKRKKERKQAKIKVKEFVENLTPKLNESDEIENYVTYDSLKEAVVITKEEIVPADEGFEYFLYDYGEKDFDEYVKVITNDMYFLDTRNKIRALRETKKIAQNSSKHLKVKETKLELFEEKDFPTPLPVEKKLELIDKYYM